MAHGENRRKDSSDLVIIIFMVYVLTNMILGLYFLWTFVWNFNNYDTKNGTLVNLLPCTNGPNIVLLRWTAYAEVIIGHSLLLILFGFGNKLKLRFLILDAWTFTRFLLLVIWLALSYNKCDWPISRSFYLWILICLFVLEIVTAILCNELLTDDDTVKTTEGHVENIELESIQIMAANVTQPRNVPMKANSNDLSKPMNIITHNEVPFPRNV